VLLRLLGAITFVALGFVAIWQGFGIAGFGTDLHGMRIGAAILPLVSAGLILTARGWLSVRVLAVIFCLGAASWGWWDMQSGNLKSAMSLREAVAERERYRGALAGATLDNFEQHHGLKGLDLLIEQYPSLTKQLTEEYSRWKASMTDEILARYDRTTPTDFKTVAVLRTAGKSLGEVHPAGAGQLDLAFKKWLLNARNVVTDELQKQPHGDWAAFNRTAPNRQEFVKLFPAARDSLAVTEEEWVNKSVEWLIAETILAAPVGTRLRAEVWRDMEKEILSLTSLDTSDERFRTARKRLFELAHGARQSEITAHLEAKRYALMFSAARKHALEWDATAKMLGPEALKKIDTLRAACQPFAALAEKAPDEIEIAPAPREKP
jgi:hypothetical protein